VKKQKEIKKTSEETKRDFTGRFVELSSVIEYVDKNELYE
jgi:hypothetical protein